MEPLCSACLLSIHEMSLYDSEQRKQNNNNAWRDSHSRNSRQTFSNILGGDGWRRGERASERMSTVCMTSQCMSEKRVLCALRSFRRWVRSVILCDMSIVVVIVVIVSAAFFMYGVIVIFFNGFSYSVAFLTLHSLHHVRIGKKETVTQTTYQSGRPTNTQTQSVS